MAKTKIIKSINIVLNLSVKEATFLRALCQNAILDVEDESMYKCREDIFTALDTALRDGNSTGYINGPRD